MKRITSLITGAALAAMLVTAPASAQVQGGLVNVFITDIQIIDDVPVTVILEDINVGIGVAANIAAEVCGVAVGVLASQLGQTGTASCQVGDQTVTLTRFIND